MKQLTHRAAAGLALLVCLAVHVATAQAAAPTLTVLQNFSTDTTGGGLFGGLVQGTDGALYGTAAYGGSDNSGTVFKLNPDGSGFTVLYNFPNPATTGRTPYAGLIQAADGALYGTTSSGGSGGGGTVFKLNPDGSGVTVLKNFDNDGGQGNATGSDLYSGLLQGADGMLYGTARSGGSGGDGTVYRLNPDGSGFTVLSNFEGGTGHGPWAGLIQGTDGALYGTAQRGGFFGYGTLFKLNPDGSGFTVLREFDVDTYYYTDQAGFPVTTLVQVDGCLYGTLSRSLASGGVLFKFNLGGGGFTRLIRLASDNTTGFEPKGRLVQGPGGALYGTCSGGGSTYSGTVYKMSLDGSVYTVLVNFDYSNGADTANTTGSFPQAGLILGTDGALYGTTPNGGSGRAGTVFRLSFGPPPAPDLEVLTLTTKNNQAPQGQKVTLTAVVKNTGTAAAGASTTVIKDGSTVLASVATPALGIGDSVTLTFDMRTATQNGIHVLSATADAANVVPESNESNNTRTLTVNIRGNQVR